MSNLPPTGPPAGDDPASGSLPPSPPPLFGTRPPDLPPVPGDHEPERPRSRRWQLPLAVVVAVALLIGSFAAGWSLRDRDGDDGDTASSGDQATPVTFDDDTEDRPTEPPIESADDQEEPVAAVADAVAPTVVQLETPQGLGSGVIYDPDGLVLTAAHVIEGTQDVTVRLADGRSLQGTVVGADVDSDIGVIAIADAPQGLPVATMADSAPDVGDLAVAVGSPYGLDQTVTSGIVSALDRPAPAGGPAVGTIQIDTPINPGNSGGPVANREGEIIGIASYIQSETGGNVGLGFAVPVDIAARVADALVGGRTVEFGYLGIEGGDAAGGAGSVPGALIANVQPGSPADEGGLRDGDLVTKVDGQTVASFGDLGVVIRRHAPGDQLALTVSRDGEEQEITVTLGSTAEAGD